MKILLTGGTGFIGSHFLNKALAEDHSILALRRTNKSIPRISLSEQPQWLDRQLDQVTSEELKGCDVLVHLAAHTGNVPYDNHINCLTWNLIKVMELFEQARVAGIKQFIVAGSCFEYGRSGERYDAIPTYAPLEPTNSYAASKAATSIALIQWANEHSLSLEILRVFHVFGEGELISRFWPALRKAALSGEDFPMTQGEQIRDFLPVESVASAFLKRVIAPRDGSPEIKIYNLSCGRPESIRSFAERWWGTLGASGRLLVGHIPYRSNEVYRYVAGDNMIVVA
jgi:nucleoside-diphosphate-sugar epimerase